MKKPISLILMLSPFILASCNDGDLIGPPGMFVFEGNLSQTIDYDDGTSLYVWAVTYRSGKISLDVYFNRLESTLNDFDIKIVIPPSINIDYCTDVIGEEWSATVDVANYQQCVAGFSGPVSFSVDFPSEWFENAKEYNYDPPYFCHNYILMTSFGIQQTKDSSSEWENGFWMYTYYTRDYRIEVVENVRGYMITREDDLIYTHYDD